MRAAPEALRDDLRDDVRDLLQAAYRRAGDYDLEGLAALDFLYLLERTRRYNGASLASQFGLVFTPFLNPDLIRAAYALRASGGGVRRRPAPDQPAAPLRHRVQPARVARDRVRGGPPARRPAGAPRSRGGRGGGPGRRADWRPSTGKQYYDYDLYWDEVGGPLVDRLTRDDGPWTDVFDAARVRGGRARRRSRSRSWPSSPRRSRPPTRSAACVRARGYDVTSPCKTLSPEQGLLDAPPPRRELHTRRGRRPHPSGAGGANHLIREIVRRHWGALGGAAASTVLMTLADLAQPWPLKYLIDNLVTGRSIPFTITSSDLRTLLLIAAAVVGIALLDALATYTGDLWLKRAGESIAHELRLQMYTHLQRLSLAYHDRRQKGDLVTRLTGDANSVGTLFSENLGTIAQAILTLIGMMSSAS